MEHPFAMPAGDLERIALTAVSTERSSHVSAALHGAIFATNEMKCHTATARAAVHTNVSFQQACA